MLRGISARQFAEWMAFDEIEPFNEERMDLRFGSVVQTLLNLHGRKKGQRAYQLEECVIRFGAEREKPKSAEQARAEVQKTMDLLMVIYNSPAEEPKRRVRRER